MKIFMSKRVCLRDKIVAAAIIVENGKIKKIIPAENVQTLKNDTTVNLIDYGDKVLMSGIIDSHVHVNEPGRTDWEGYLTATKAAAAGGCTTIIDMPLNSIPPTTTLRNLQLKQKSTIGQIYVDVGFWGGFIPNNQDDLLKLVDAGVVGFKCFMCPSGVDEFPNVNEEEIKQAIKILENTNVILSFHAEVEEHIDVKDQDPTKYNTFLKTRPDEVELKAIQTILELSKKHNVHCHIVHLSTSKALKMIEKAKANGQKITVETCHHYLSLKSEDIPDKATQFKCCPPIRNGNNQEELWKGISNKIIDLVVSDHSPCTPDLKLLDSGDFLKAWGGISSLQFGLSLFWTEARNRGFNICDVSRLMTLAPAKLCGLHDRKGEIKEDFDADFVVWDPDEQYEITESIIFHKNKVTPYLGKKLYGKVFETVVRGQTVYKDGAHADIPLGKLLKKIKTH